MKLRIRAKSTEKELVSSLGYIFSILESEVIDDKQTLMNYKKKL